MFTTTSDADGFRKGGTVRAANGDGSINAAAGSGLCLVIRACRSLGLASFRADADDARNNQIAIEASGWVVIISADDRAVISCCAAVRPPDVAIGRGVSEVLLMWRARETSLPRLIL